MSPSALDECHLVDFPQSRLTQPDLLDRRVAQECHSLVARHAFDLRGRPLVENHLADAFGQIQQLVDGSPAAESGAAAFKTALPFIKRLIAPFRGIEAALDEI